MNLPSRPVSSLAPRYDAIIAGGSFAGSATAVALARLGYEVLLCEPGLANDKRLAGELLQAPAAAVLRDLGFLPKVWAQGAVPSTGFAVFPGAGAAPVVLSYAEVPGMFPTGVAIEHSLLGQTMLEHAAMQPGVTFCQARVERVSDWMSDACNATVRSGSTSVNVGSRIVVAADGRMSKLREQVGISVKKSPAFRMLGYKLEGAHLPCEGYGHVFLGGHRPILAYRIAANAVRVMFELEDEHAKRPHPADLASLPASLAEAVARQTTLPLSTMVFGITPSARASGRVALVGDAGGAVHPISASGVSFAVSDAVLLASNLRALPDGIAEGLARYSEQREASMRTRTTFGPALAEALGSDASAMVALRDGLLRYWQTSRSGRSRSMALLSTHDSRRRVLVGEYGRVVMHALARDLWRKRSLRSTVGLGMSLGRKALGVARESLAPIEG